MDGKYSVEHMLAAVLKWVLVSFRATDDAALSEEDARWS